MNVGCGVGLLLGGAAIGLTTALLLWKRLPAIVPVVMMAAAGLLIGAGALLVQRSVGAADWAVTLTLMGILSPLHCRVLFGRPGGRGLRTVLAEDLRHA